MRTLAPLARPIMPKQCALRTKRMILAAAVVCAAATTTPDARQTEARSALTPDVVWRTRGEGHGRPAADERTVYWLTAHHEVIALDAVSGVPRWRQHTSEPGAATAGSSLTLAGPIVVAGDYNLIAFDRRTGAKRWRFSPLIGHAPGIYLGEAAAGLVFAGSPAGRLYAVDARHGALVWTTAIAEDGRTTAFQPVSDGVVVAAGFTTFTAPNRGGVVLLDAQSGRQRWRTPFPPAADQRLGTGATGAPIVTETHVIASSGDGFIYGLDRSTGAVAWMLPPLESGGAPMRSPLPSTRGLAGADFRPLARSGQRLFVGSLLGAVVAYDLDTRERRWVYADDSSGSVAFGLASDERSVYVPFASGRHVALDQSTGVERWRTADPREGFSWPAASGGAHVYLVGERGGVLAIRR